MMDWTDLLRALHVLGACVLIGTGFGIAFFMSMAHRSGKPEVVAHTASVVVFADMAFTATAAIAQPITGWLLMQAIGWHYEETWLILSFGLYVFIGFFWLPVIFIQTQMRNEAQNSVRTKMPLSARYKRLYRLWLVCGVPAFLAILMLLWLMVNRPLISF
jgi:uncharacterized membrane protein